MVGFDKKKRSGQFHTHLGGSLFNVALGLGRLRSPVFYLDVISEDIMGQMFVDAFKENNISLDFVERSPSPSGLAWIFPQGDFLEYRFYIKGTSLVEINQKKVISNKVRNKVKNKVKDQAKEIREIKVFHLGSFTSILNPKADYYYNLGLSFKQKKCLITYDVNARPLITKSSKEVMANVERNLALADVIKISDEDFVWAFAKAFSRALKQAQSKVQSKAQQAGGDPQNDLRGRLVDQLVEKWARKKENQGKLILYTKGEKGVEVFWRNWSYKTSAIKVKVVDTIGSGDTFMANVLNSIERLGLFDRDRFDQMSQETVVAMINSANLAAAINCQRSGANPPTQKEIKEFKA